MQPYLLIEGLMGRWVIVHADSPGLAWSGAHWVPHDRGIPTGDTQVCNFSTREEAQEYINERWNAYYPVPPFD